MVKRKHQKSRLEVDGKTMPVTAISKRHLKSIIHYTYYKDKKITHITANKPGSMRNSWFGGNFYPVTSHSSLAPSSPFQSQPKY